jgi:outer membrane scaffolding protein for murein synthesis (MipA/OmpV family)
MEPGKQPIGLGPGPFRVRLPLLEFHVRLRVLLLCLPTAVLAAQDPLPFLDRGPGPESRWTVELGARAADLPAYPGSDRRRAVLLPVFAAEYDQRWYLGSSRVGPGFGGGVHLVRSDGFTWDLGAGVGDRRPETRSALLAGMGDRRAEVFMGTGLSWRSGGYRAGLTLTRGLRDDGGDRATVTAGRTWRLAPRWFLSAGGHMIWADAKAMAYDYGISPEQAANRAALAAAGNPVLTPGRIGPYAPGGGLRDFGANLGLAWSPKPRWIWSAGLFGGSLQGGARTSPLVERTTYLAAGGGFSYRF